MIPSLKPSTAMPWIAVVVRPRTERKAQEGLSRSGIQNFVAWYRVRRRWSDRMKTVEFNLFPGYIFCRCDYTERLVVMRQPGVEWMVKFNHTPALIPDEEIEALRRALASGLPVGPWPFLKAGQRVRIERGVLAGVEGKLARDSEAWRIVVSVDALHRSVAVEVDREMFRLLDEHPSGLAAANRTAVSGAC
jgi:transcription antitermination factor NusG